MENFSIKMDILVSIVNIVTSKYEQILKKFIEPKLRANLELILKQFTSLKTYFQDLSLMLRQSKLKTNAYVFDI